MVCLVCVCVTEGHKRAVSITGVLPSHLKLNHPKIGLMPKNISSPITPHCLLEQGRKREREREREREIEGERRRGRARQRERQIYYEILAKIFSNAFTCQNTTLIYLEEPDLCMLISFSLPVKRLLM